MNSLTSWAAHLLLKTDDKKLKRTEKQDVVNLNSFTPVKPIEKERGDGGMDFIQHSWQIGSNDLSNNHYRRELGQRLSSEMDTCQHIRIKCLVHNFRIQINFKNWSAVQKWLQSTWVDRLLLWLLLRFSYTWLYIQQYNKWGMRWMWGIKS